MATFSELINGSKPVLVDFYADWCAPCKALAPIIKELKAIHKDKLTILKVDIDRNQATANKYNIRGVPTLILFKNGQPIWRQSGVVPLNQLDETLRKFITS